MIREFFVQNVIHILINEYDTKASTHLLSCLVSLLESDIDLIKQYVTQKQ